MAKIDVTEKLPPNNSILRITSTSLEEKVFLSGLYQTRALPSRLIENPDGSVTIEYTY